MGRHFFNAHSVDREPLPPPPTYAATAQRTVRLRCWAPGTDPARQVVEDFAVGAIEDALDGSDIDRSRLTSLTRTLTRSLDAEFLTVACCKPVLAEQVAELAIAQLVLALRAPERQRRQSLGSCTVGVVGGGSQVGRRVIRLLLAFGCRVLTYDPFLRPSDAAAQGCELVGSVEEMCRHVSALTVHAPPTPSAL